MAGTVPARTPLGAATTNRKWYLDVQDPAAPGVWVSVFGQTEGKPRPSDATTQDDSDFDGGGYGSDTTTALKWGYEGKVNRKTVNGNATAYDPGQEIIRKAAKTIGGVIRARYYEMEPNGPRVEAYEGLVSPTWTPDGGGMDALDSASFNLRGRGAPVEIAHPEGVTPAPVITAVSPSGVAAGGSVVIRGDKFTGVTGAANVKFGATNATSYVVIDDDTIQAVMPAGSAGPVTVTVGTTVSSFLYTRGA